jgi:hypothetical protein
MVVSGEDGSLWKETWLLALVVAVAFVGIITGCMMNFASRFRASRKIVDDFTTGDGQKVNTRQYDV